MHTCSDRESGVPAFLAKLWRLVEDAETNNLIYWSQDGRSFVIQNQAQFARDLLPLNYKHNNMASFIRQLNMYGFHKITSIDNGGLKFDRDEMEFSHPYFIRGSPKLLENIKRKIATTKQNLEEKNGTVKSDSVNKVINEVKAMRGRQETLDSRFSVMKQENEALWREIATLRQKHIKQQQIVNKLIQFLVTIVQPSRNMTGVKRQFQLMINNVPHSSKMRKISEGESGPIIHELTEELLDEVAESAECDLFETGSPHMAGGLDIESVHSPNSHRPQSNVSISSHFYDNSNESDGGEEIDYSPTTYEISEIPENKDRAPDVDLTFIDDNVLNTPLVKKEMARDQKLQQNVQQHQEKQSKIDKTQQRMRRKRPVAAHSRSNISTSDLDDSVQIKSENDLDSLIFLEDVSSNAARTSHPLDSDLISRKRNSNQPVPSTSTSTSTLINQQNDFLSGNQQQNDKELFDTNDFLTSEMPSDIFEESNSYDPSIELLKMKNPVQCSDGGQNVPAKSLAVTKYNSQKSLNSDDILREDVTTHIDNVQDDLDNLKDLLRGEGYSLDANALMGNNGNNSSNRMFLSPTLDNDILLKLFNDADILNPYGLSQLPNEMHQDNNKKGSELMTYQPYYSDFSDILEMNDKTPEYNEDKSNDFPELSSSSVLNTPHPQPHPERELI